MMEKKRSRRAAGLIALSVSLAAGTSSVSAMATGDDVPAENTIVMGTEASPAGALESGLGTAYEPSALSSMTSGTGEFHIGAFQQPMIRPTDYNTSAHWQNIANAYLDRMISVETSGGINYTKAENENGIANSYAKGVQLFVTDGGLYDYQSYTPADYATLESRLAPYKNDSRVSAINIKDEPAAWHIEGYANTIRHAMSYAPQLDYYINLAPVYVEDHYFPTAGKLALSNSGAQQNGTFVTSTQRLGQTVKIPAGMTNLHGVDLKIDMREWSSAETLTLKLWDSPSRTTMIAQRSLAGNGSGDFRLFFPYFELKAPVTPGSTYYVELTHNGGGNNSVGWVQHSDTSLYGDGAAYVNGSAQSYDLFFRLYKPRDNTPDILSPGNTDGDYVSNSTRIGQTFTTPASVNRRIHYIQLNMDAGQWASGQQPITLTLWDSPARTRKISVSDTYTSSNNGNYPIFKLYQPVSPNTSYYFEITSSSGAPLGWVTKGTSSTYAGGQGYKNGTALAGGTDYYFKVVFGSFYDNFMDDLLDISGTDELLFDNYPFRAGTGYDASYFLNAELIRERGLDHNVKYGGYLQSTKIQNSNGTFVKYRNPNLGEKRWNVYTYLTYGFKLMYWFTYWQPLPVVGWDEYFADTPVSTNGTLQTAYYDIQALNREMHYLGETLKDLTSQGVYHSGTSIPRGTQPIPDSLYVKPADASQPLLLGTFANASGRKYVMLTNRDYASSRTVTFNLFPRPASVTEISKSTGLEVGTGFTYNAASGQLTISLDKGEGRLFALPTGAGDATPLANGGFESGTAGWSNGFGGTFTVDAAIKRSGTASGKIASRTLTHASPTQDVTNVLRVGGQGNYSLAGWIKLASGTDRAQVAIQIDDSAGRHWAQTDMTNVNATGWTQSTKLNNITWTGQLNSAILYVQTESTLGDLYIDDLSLTK
ncbi:MAG: hypothetical protein K0Q63_12 [Paenibacillus sp.]|nr:hypothetical protein [Paenibacillus sp.]